MKKITLSALAVAACLMTSCDIERFPNSSLSTDQITGDPDGSLQYMLNGCYAQLKTWSDPMHRCGEYAGDNMMIRGTSTDAFYEFISYAVFCLKKKIQHFWHYC